MKSTLLLLALFGAVCGHSWINNYALRSALFGQDSAETMVQKFLSRMVKSIESKDTSAISGLFQSGFVFKGCKGVYNKEQIVGLLMALPANTQFSMSIKSVEDLGASIKYTVSATGFGASAVEADFILNKAGQQLESGVVPACQKSHFHGFIAQDSAQVMVEKFLARMSRSIQSKDTAIIKGLFQPGFIFKGCKGVYNKEQIVGLLSQLPSGNQFSLSLKSVEDLGASIKYTVSASGFSASAIEAEFVLNKVDQQLESGVVPACQKSHFHGFIAQDSAQVMVGKFLSRMVRSIESKDFSIIRGLFQPGFEFKGCKATYNKEQVVGMLSKIPSGTKFSLVLKSVEDLGASIKYAVSASGFSASAIDAEFVLNKVDQQLESGAIPTCQTSLFIPYGIIGRSPAQQPDSAQVIAEFLKSAKPIFASRDAAKIGALFDDAFQFMGCQGVYTKAQAVEKIVSGPVELDFELLSSRWSAPGQIEYVVRVSMPRMDSIQAQFVYCPERGVLKSGGIPTCMPKRFY